MLLKRLSVIAVLLAAVVVALGAFTRLQDAGLGCPDWPGCYGQLTVPKSESDIARANASYPHRPLEAEKAWAEMVHRYFASTLGVLIISILYLSMRARKHNPQQPIKLPIALLCLVIFQGMLGMWTVTLSLYPPVVMAHLLGGFTTLCLLFLLAIRLHRPASNLAIKTPQKVESYAKWSLLGVFILTFQIALGGWTAANYAATICTELPLCQTGWQQHINLPDAFQLWGHDDSHYEFAPHLKPDAKITIHVSHRIGALITTLYLIVLFAYLLRSNQFSSFTQRVAAVGLGILTIQVVLGVSNIVLQLPLAIAVAHNGFAAILMMTLILLTFSLYQTGGRSHVESRTQPTGY